MNHVRVRVVLTFLTLALLGCGNRLREGEASTGPTPEPGAADVAVAESPGGAERRWVVYADDLRLLEISDTPGFLVDSTAPPPPPGVDPARHPFLTAGCGGDPLLCSRAGNLLRESTTLPEFLDRLGAEGWRVEEVTAPAE